MPTNEEKTAFSKRLRLALRRSKEPVHGATELALRFNLRHRGNAISAQTAHKWLSGRAIPTSDKLLTLAEWLDVNEHWLHYGPPPSRPLHVAESKQAYGTPEAGTLPGSRKSIGKPSPEAIDLAVKIQALPPHRRYLMEELVDQLQEDIG